MTDVDVSKRGPKAKFQLLPTDDLSNLRFVVYNLLKAAENGASYATLAVTFSIPEGTVKSRLSRARLRLLAARQVLPGE